MMNFSRVACEISYVELLSFFDISPEMHHPAFVANFRILNICNFSHFSRFKLLFNYKQYISC